jgi:ketopantoate reductase
MRELVIIGVGELGTLFGGGALRVGARVTPITRTMSAVEVLRDVAVGTPVLISVGENALPDVLATLPAAHRDAVVLLQNELFPSTYQAHGLTPSVLVPWVLQKRGMPTIVARPSPIYAVAPRGPVSEGHDLSALFAQIFDALSLAHVRLTNQQELAQALVDKYAFLLTINALGLSTDRTLGMWLQEDAPQVWDICAEATRLGEALVAAPVDAEQARSATQEAMIALAHMPARGRTARERVTRALGHAVRLRLSLPALARIANS